MSRSFYVLIPLLLALVVLQATLLARLPVFGVTLQPALLVVIGWSLLRSPYEAIVWAFVSGMALDMFSVGPTGGMALALMLTVLPLAYLNQVLPENPYLMPILLTALGIVISHLVYLLIIWLAQRGFRATLLLNLPLTVLINTLIAIPLYWWLRWLSRVLYPRQIEM